MPTHDHPEAAAAIPAGAAPITPEAYAGAAVYGADHPQPNGCSMLPSNIPAPNDATCPADNDGLCTAPDVYPELGVRTFGDGDW
ncbi:MAG: hypothetical protein K6T81_15780 [Alicyclobacillus macrosporangiidus]|uniref:hypothetical protein n=1 Tax=Alicyclobacillus macrosporangiidus TaxID=392015 RepID=UPI0026F37979|nr:hypothetical protein [Alicyclobacillus macrosporangiidus]MCL6600178.1 hypothetical protein [Alicyclobacillus macrosporangiidus]